MKETFQHISDIHLDKNKIENFKSIIDVNIENIDKNLIIAGDICSTINKYLYEKFINYCCKKFDNIYLIAGNHEYYNSTLDETEIYLNSLDCKYFNLHYLQMDKIITKKGNQIIGCTLWSSIPSNIDISKKLPIYNFNNCVMNILYDQNVDWLKKYINEDTLVITHYSPSLKGVNKFFNDKKDNYFYASNLDYLIDKSKYWIFGHTHQKIKDGKLLSNPYGYTNENINFDKHNLLIM